MLRSFHRDYFVITITTQVLKLRSAESWLQGLIRLIAYQMVKPEDADRENKFQCDEDDLLDHLKKINDQGRAVILLIDELSKLGVPLDPETSCFLTTHFLDKKGRYLIFSSHVPFHIDSAPTDTVSHVLCSPSGRTMKLLPLPFCTDRAVLQNMLDGSSVTDLQITLSAGIPSLLYVMCKPSMTEMTFEERFEDVVMRAGRRVCEEIKANRERALEQFLSSVITGERAYGERTGVGYFDCFSTPVDGDLQLLRFPLPYIPLILKFLEENDGVALYQSLKASAETVETGRDWELVVIFSIYIRSLEAKYCKKQTEPLRGPLEIATDGVQDVKVVTIPQQIKDVAQAVTHIREATKEAKTIYIFQLAYSKFPDFDGFVSYRPRKRRRAGQEGTEAPIIHGFQCKLTRGYPRHPVCADIARCWFLRGEMAVETPARDRWTFWTQEKIDEFGLRLLHPVAWGSVPESEDGFD